MKKSLTINNKNHTLFEDDAGVFIADSSILLGNDSLRSEIELKINAQKSSNKEEGRGVIQKVVLNGKPVVLRNYLRGGFISHLNYSTFFCGCRKNPSKYRMVSEYETLCFLSSQSCAVPVPVLALVSFQNKNGFLYCGLIGTEEIPSAVSIYQQAKELSSVELIEKLFAKCLKAGKEARKITELGVIHSDLHMANVVEDSQGNIFILDFDKAKRKVINENSRESVLEEISERWDRFVKKNGFADELCEAFHQGLMSEDR
jgi:3-deoxy-D-manno-octulosonic acid kinase